jgi:hypothetical protein
MTWTTQTELAFVRELGMHRRQCHCCGRPLARGAVPLQERLTLLRQYQAALRRRVDWGAMDPAAVGAAVARLLTELEAGGARAAQPLDQIKEVDVCR